MNKCGQWALSAAVVTLAAAGAGCSSTSTCSRHEDSIDVYDGYVNADHTIYSSVEPAGLDANGEPLTDAELQALPPYTYFPANRSITFHIGLIGAPTAINIALSFSPDRDVTVAPSAGNQSLIRGYNKDKIVLRNDTCSEFWVWLTASTSATPFQQVSDGGVEPSAAGASGSDPGDSGGGPSAP